MSEHETRSEKITTMMTPTERKLLNEFRLQSGATTESDYIRASALRPGRIDIASIRHDLRLVWGEQIKLSARVAASEDIREQKVVLKDCRTTLAQLAKLIQKLDQLS